MSEGKINLIVIVGPTASGKTRLSLDIAKKFDGEIISADSMQIYKEFEISTAKPSRDEMDGIRHHLISEISVKEEFSVADFVNKARVLISDVNARGKTPIIVGGTGLYVDSLINNVKFEEERVDEKLREKLWKEVKNNGIEKLIKELSVVDKCSAENIHPNNFKKIIRALEFYRTTGKPISQQVKFSKMNVTPYKADIIGLNFRDRNILYNRINKRVDYMVRMGLIDEVRRVYKSGIGKTASGAIGYKEVVPYLRGLCTVDEMTEKVKLETRHYAKRQLTWFRRNENINWFYVDDYENYQHLLLDTLNHFEKH